MQWQKPHTEGVYQIVVRLGVKAGEEAVQVLSKSPLQGLVTAAARDHVLGWSASPEGKNHGDTSGWKTLVLE